MTSPVAPAVGDQALIATYLINTRVYGYVVPGTSTQEFTATYEIVGDQGTLTLAAVLGPEGPAGADMFVLNLQTDAIDQPANLPETLTNTQADLGKTWLFDDVDALGEVIGSSAYVWYGKSYRRMMFGQPGPPGPVPIITPDVDLITWPGNSYVDEDGTPYEPTMTFKLAVPPGERGPAGVLALCPDVDFATTPPEPGDVLGYTGKSYTTLLEVPSDLTAFSFSGGGAIPGGTYHWVVTATSGLPFGAVDGETTASNEVSATVGGSESSVMLEWIPVQGADGYNIYRTLINDVPGSESRLVASVSAADATYLDTGAMGSVASPLTTNSAVMNFPLWVPVALSQLLPSPFSMPESAFTAYSGASAQAPIGSFAIPPQPFPWTPIVWGHIGSAAMAHTGLQTALGSFFGSGASSNVMVGCQVLLGDATKGTQVARGFGNNNTEVNIMPHYSTQRAPYLAISPNNDMAVVPPNHSNPAEGTLYVNLYNDGRIGNYSFHPTDCQLFVMVLPITEAYNPFGAQPAYDTSGGGVVSTNAAESFNGSWSHTAAQGACVIVAVATYVIGTRYTTGATYGGIPMTPLGYVDTGDDTQGWIQLFGILGVTGGPQTVTASIAGGPGNPIYCVAAQSLSYTGVLNFGTFSSAYGAAGTPNVTVVAGTNQIVVQAFNATNTSRSIYATGYNGTSRFNQSLSGGLGGNMTMTFGDLPGKTSVVVSETINEPSSYWGSAAIPLIGR